MSEQKAHSEYGMSSSKRWIECAASIPLSKLAPPPLTNAAADHGTKGHECLEAFIKNPKNPFTVMNMLRGKYDEEMIQHAYESYEYIRALWAKHPGAELNSEERVDTSHFTEKGNFGTVDCSIIELFGTLYVLDYKYGVMPVDPVENTQAIGYALGIAKKWGYNFERVVVIIIQPRARSGKKTKVWEISMAKLKSYIPMFQNAVARTKEEDPEVVKGPHCFFCPARNYTCPTYMDQALERAQDDFEFDSEDVFTTDEKEAVDEFIDFLAERPKSQGPKVLHLKVAKQKRKKKNGS